MRRVKVVVKKLEEVEESLKARADESWFQDLDPKVAGVLVCPVIG